LSSKRFKIISYNIDYVKHGHPPLPQIPKSWTNRVMVPTSKSQPYFPQIASLQIHLLDVIMPSMRTTITIPDSYYQKIKKEYASEGYLTVNDFILELIRRHFSDGRVLEKTHRADAHLVDDKTQSGENIPIAHLADAAKETLKINEEEHLAEAFEKASGVDEREHRTDANGKEEINSDRLSKAGFAARGRERQKLFNGKGD